MQESVMRRMIAHKRDGGRVDDAAWEGIVNGFLAGEIREPQMASFLMACVLRELDLAETIALTRATVASGRILTYTRGPVIDKHSSGGVGDTISLLAVPMAAAAGATVAKLAGHALGHTGGTLDKLEALPGVRVALSISEFTTIVERVGCAIAAQTDLIVPADGRIYALRDQTATVPSVGLIAASIVSKKIAAGADAIVYDIKMGTGAFMPDLASATELAERIVAVTRAFGRRCTALITEMSAPLGSMLGSGLEALEALALLGSRSASGSRLAQLALIIADEMLIASGLAPRAAEVLADGSAAAKMLEMLAAQGGDLAAIGVLAPAAPVTIVTAKNAGYVTAISPVELGECARDLVAASGPFAGIELLTAVGHRVDAGAPIARIYGASVSPKQIAAAVSIGDTAPPAPIGHPRPPGSLIRREGQASVYKRWSHAESSSPRRIRRAACACRIFFRGLRQQRLEYAVC